VVSITANFKDSIRLSSLSSSKNQITSLTGHKLIKTDVNFTNISEQEEELLIHILQRKSIFLQEIDKIKKELTINSQNLEITRKILELDNPNDSNVSRDRDPTSELFNNHAQQNKMNYIKLFNRNPAKGIAKLIEMNIIEENSVEAIAEFLFYENSNKDLPPLLKTAIGEYLGKKNLSPDDKNEQVLTHYVNLFKPHFHNQSLLTALRIFLDKFKLPGEAQQIDRIIQTFADVYVGLNTNYLREKVKNSSCGPANPDSVYILTFAIIMLNTALHNPNVKDKMSCSDFIKMNQNQSQNQSQSANSNSNSDSSSPTTNYTEWTSQFLEHIYKEIEKNEIKFPSQNTDAMYGTAKAKVFEEPEIEGWLLIKSGESTGLKSIYSRPKWSKKYCCLTKRMLCYVNKLEDLEPKGIITIENLKCVSIPDDEKNRNINIFELCPDDQHQQHQNHHIGSTYSLGNSHNGFLGSQASNQPQGIRRALWNNNKQNHEWHQDSKLTSIKFSAHSPIDKSRWMQAINECLGVDSMYELIKSKRVMQ